MARDREPVGRPRDTDGRPRNSRPRDELGRLLEVGETGVERAVEGVERTPAESLALAQRLLDEGRPFHAHEVLEDAWKQAPDPEKELWRGLAQLAVGLTHRARGNEAGAQSLLRRGATSVTPFAAAPPYGLDVAGLIARAHELAADPAGESLSLSRPPV